MWGEPLSPTLEDGPWLWAEIIHVKLIEIGRAEPSTALRRKK